MLKRTAAFWLALTVAGPSVGFSQGFPGPGCGCTGSQSPPVFAPLAPFFVRPTAGYPGYPGPGYPGPMMPGPYLPGPVAPAPMMQPWGAPCATAAPMVPLSPPALMQTTLRPVYETRMRQEQVTSYENVARTEMRREAMQVTVPVTTQKQVMVDQGSYQMVWVPRPVSKTIAETTYRQETRYRDVPYQVVQSVPRQITRMVPEQTVRYVPETQMVQGCLGCPAQALFGPPVMSAATFGTAPVLTPIPETQSQSPKVPSPYEASGAAPSTGAQPAAPVQSSDNSEWQTIKQRTAASDGEIQQQSYAVSEPVQPIEDPSVRPLKRMFSPVPSAAAVWQSQLRR